MEGVEPTRLAALDPKSSASANFATSAQQYYPVMQGLILIYLSVPGRKNRGI